MNNTGLFKLPKTKNLFPYLLLIPALAVLLFVILYPLAYSLVISFYRYSLLKPFLGKTFVGLAHYKEKLTDPSFLYSLNVTGRFTLFSVAIEFVLGFGIALILSKIKKGRRLVTTGILIPMMIAPVAVGVMWIIMYHPDLGVINYFLKVLGIAPKIWLGDPRLALLAVIVTDIWQMTPFVFLIMLAGIESLPLELYDAARVDGATAFQRFFHITIPLLKQTIAIVLLIRIMDALRVFDKIWILTRGGPGEATEVINVKIYLTCFTGFRMGESAAMCYIVFAIIMIISLSYIRGISKREAK